MDLIQNYYAAKKEKAQKTSIIFYVKPKQLKNFYTAFSCNLRYNIKFIKLLTPDSVP